MLALVKAVELEVAALLDTLSSRVVELEAAVPSVQHLMSVLQSAVVVGQ